MCIRYTLPTDGPDYSYGTHCSLYYDQVIRFVPNIHQFESNGMNMLNLKSVEKK